MKHVFQQDCQRSPQNWGEASAHSSKTFPRPKKQDESTLIICWGSQKPFLCMSFPKNQAFCLGLERKRLDILVPIVPLAGFNPPHPPDKMSQVQISHRKSRLKAPKISKLELTGSATSEVRVAEHLTIIALLSFGQKPGFRRWGWVKNQPQTHKRCIQQIQAVKSRKMQCIWIPYEYPNWNKASLA